MLALLKQTNALSLETKKLRVMVVDDNVIYRRLLTRMLKKHHASSIATIVEFECPLEALAYLARSEVDALFMDIDMPGLQGTRAAEIIRTSSNHNLLSHNRNIPIIAFSTNSSQDDILSYLKAGMDGFMEKPLRPSSLMHMINFIQTLA